MTSSNVGNLVSEKWKIAPMTVALGFSGSDEHCIALVFFDHLTDRELNRHAYVDASLHVHKRHLETLCSLVAFSNPMCHLYSWRRKVRTIISVVIVFRKFLRFFFSVAIFRIFFLLLIKIKSEVTKSWCSSASKFFFLLDPRSDDSQKAFFFR